MKYLVNIYATEHYWDANGNTIWSKVWSKAFEDIEQANRFAEYQENEFGRKHALLEFNKIGWKIIADTRY